MKIDTAEVPSPIGTIALCWGDEGLCALEFEARWSRIERALARRFGEVSLRRTADPGGVARKLRAYFQGDLKALDEIEVDPGGTAFQREVWAALRRVPAGGTASYGDLARAIGRPKAVRAVGLANGANPVPVVVPCHRIIGADGLLTGYGGGLRRKAWLLRHEGAAFRERRARAPQPGLPFAAEA